MRFLEIYEMEHLRTNVELTRYEEDRKIIEERGGGGEEKMAAPSFRNSMYNFSISKYKLIDCTIVGFETSVALYAPHKPL